MGCVHGQEPTFVASGFLPIGMPNSTKVTTRPSVLAHEVIELNVFCGSGAGGGMRINLVQKD